MRCNLLGVSVLIVACIVCGTASATFHTAVTPVPCPNGTEVLSTAYTSSTGLLPYPVFELSPTFNEPVTAWPETGSYDFCATGDNVGCSLGAFGGISTDIAQYQVYFMCTADINGPLDTLLDPPMTPNGMADGKYELQVLARVLNTPTHPLYTATLNAFKANVNFFKQVLSQALSNIDGTDYRPAIELLAPHCAGSLAAQLAGYATLGDPVTYDTLDALLAELSGLGVTVPTGGVKAVTVGIPQLAITSDTDGDGFINKEEYNFFIALNETPDQIVTDILDPNLHPTGPAAVIMGAGSYEVGAYVELICAVSTPGTTSIVDNQWYKGGVAIPGENSLSLIFSSATEADTGTYSVKTTLDTNAILESRGVYLRIVPVGSLPIAGGLGMALLAGACALAGAAGIRRK